MSLQAARYFGLGKWHKGTSIFATSRNLTATNSFAAACPPRICSRYHECNLDATQLQLAGVVPGRGAISSCWSLVFTCDWIASAYSFGEKNEDSALTSSRFHILSPFRGWRPHSSRPAQRPMVRRVFSCSLLALVLAALACPSLAQESPYIVTYDHYLEEPGNLEVEYFSTFGTQRAGNDFHAFWGELEDGVKAWWTTELYVDGQSTFHDSTIFTGVRWENRFRLLQREHFVNPVLYIEYERKNGADKILKEVEGVDAESDFADSNSALRQEHVNELEFKLLLSKTYQGWNFAVNPLAAKNLSNNPWEFGYAVGASHPLALKASPN